MREGEKEGDEYKRMMKRREADKGSRSQRERERVVCALDASPLSINESTGSAARQHPHLQAETIDGCAAGNWKQWELELQIPRLPLREGQRQKAKDFP